MYVLCTDPTQRRFLAVNGNITIDPRMAKRYHTLTAAERAVRTLNTEAFLGFTTWTVRVHVPRRHTYEQEAE